MPYRVNPMSGRLDYYEIGGSGSGAGLTIVIPQGYPAVMSQGDSVTVEHPAVTNARVLVQCMENIGQSGLQDISIDFDLADEGLYIQEDAVNGTDIVDGRVTLHNAGGSLADLTSPTGTVYYSSQYNDTNYAARNIFDNSNRGGTGWIISTDSNINDGWVTYDFETPTMVTKYRKADGAAGAGGGGATAWDILGSNDAQDWVILDSQVGQSLYIAAWSPYYTISSPGSYRYYRIHVHNGVRWCGLEELEYVCDASSPVGTPYYVITPVFDCGVRKAKRINSVAVDYTQPTGTQIKVLVSFDGGTSWRRYDGNTWVSVSGATLRDMLNATDMDIPMMQRGLTNLMVSDARIRIAIDLLTAVASITPAISGITINYDQRAFYSPRNDNYNIEVVDATHTVITRTAAGSAEVIPQVIIL